MPEQQQRIDPTLAVCVTAVIIAAIGAFAWVQVQTSQPVVNPVVPTVTLGSLVPDATHRAQLARFYADYAMVVEDPNYPVSTTDGFRSSQQMAVKLMKGAGRLPDVSAINGPISERIKTSQGGLDNKELDKASLAKALRAISVEFGGGDA